MGSKFLQITLLCFFSFSLFAQKKTIEIDDIFFNKDESIKMILINKDVRTLNSEYPNLKNQIHAENAYYTFAVPVGKFETGKKYSVTNAYGTAYDLYFTLLPIINIDTTAQIVNEPRVFANFSLCENDGTIVEHGIGVEYRGGSTQAYPKKSLRIEFWNDENGDDTENLELLDMRSDDDWNLQAMYKEPLRMRTKICFELWNKIDTLYYTNNEPEAINGVRQEFVELFVSNEYRGVYALSERVDKKQLKLKKLKNGKIKGELYKGKEWGGANTFTSLSPYDNSSDFWGGFKYIYPDSISWENLYNFVDFVINSDSSEFYGSYADRFKIENAVDYFIFLNLLRAQDNTGKNIYVAKYKKDEPYFYVPWDLDATLGINWLGDNDNITNDIQTNGLYERLVRDTAFTNRLTAKWTSLKETVILTDNIVAMFNKYYNYLDTNGVYERESKAWSEINFDYAESINYLTSWLNNRISYLDYAFNNPNSLINIKDIETTNKISVNIYPNPASSFVNVKLFDNKNKIKNISIYNTLGNNILNTNKTKIDISMLKNGIYFVIIDLENNNRYTEKLLVQD